MLKYIEYIVHVTCSTDTSVQRQYLPFRFVRPFRDIIGRIFTFTRNVVLHIKGLRVSTPFSPSRLTTWQLVHGIRPTCGSRMRRVALLSRMRNLPSTHPSHLPSTEIGVALTSFGGLFMLLGVILFFDGALLALGNVCRLLTRMLPIIDPSTPMYTGTSAILFAALEI